MLTDWLMVVITAIYVIATIFICIYNGKSANAAKTQTEELKKQFYMANRPILAVEIVYIRKAFFALRFTNNGNQTAFNTTFDINQDFIDSLNENKFKELLEKDKGKIINIGVGQHYDLFFGTNEFLKLEKKVHISGRMIYNGNYSSTYAEDFIIETQKYATFLSVNTDGDDIKDEIKKQTIAIKKISQIMENYIKPSTEENNK